jgi:hypothetical protein
MRCRDAAANRVGAVIEGGLHRDRDSIVRYCAIDGWRTGGVASESGCSLHTLTLVWRAGVSPREAAWPRVLGTPLEVG